jgi:iron complex outermembrane receptor protein
MRVLLLLAFAPAVLVAQRDSSSKRDTVRKLEGVTVSAIRARADAPIAAKTLTEADIQRRSFGQDVPLMLQGTPSLTSYGETGNYWGYSYMRLRGIDQSRINLTLDGIPLNDPEDQVLYFADFPDLSNSLSSVQVQRGVGTSAPGSASYGGSINFQTTPLASEAPGQTAEAQIQAGSFGTLRGSVKYSSGLSARGFAANARFSAIRSAGYRRHSGVDARSGFATIGWVGERDVIKLTAIAGLFADTMAYVGATRAELAVDPRSNLLRADETDRFTEQVVALAHTRDLGNGASIANTVYRITTAGNYNVCVDVDCSVASPVIWNFNLDFGWIGATSVANFALGANRVTTGGNVNGYARDHYTFDRSTGFSNLYWNVGRKRDASLFAKVERDIGDRTTLYVDVQGRRAQFFYQPDINAGIGRSSIGWSFLNPKVGATVRLTPTLTAYASHGVNGREPARSDMFGGFDNIDTTNASFVGPLSTVRPERVHDTEFGVRTRAKRWSLDANVFAMEFRNEILPVGQLSYIGTPLRTNVPSSWRRGLELDGSANLDRMQLGATATLMRARIASFTDFTDSLAPTYRNTPPLLTPEFTSTHWANVAVSRSISIGATGRFVGSSYLNNTKSDALTLPSQYTLDVTAHWNSGGRGLSLHVNNALNSKRFASGHVAYGEARYYVLPPLNVMLLARLGL